MTRLTLSIFPTLLIGLSSGVPAQAQANRTFISGTGSDSNACTFVVPCRTAQQAHDVTNPGGEIVVLDPAGYGALTITKAISIQGHGWGELAGSNGATAITINAGPNDLINLRGLVVEGFGSGLDGIHLTSGGSLNVQDSVIRNFSNAGIVFGPTAASDLKMSHMLVTDFSSVSAAIFIQPSGSGSATAVIDHVELDRGLVGLNVDSGFTTGNITITIADSVISHFTSAGIRAHTTGPINNVMVRNCTVSHNGTGINSDGSSAIVRVTKSTITANSTGFSAFNSARLISYGDNNLDGNTTDGAPTSTIALK
jgi:hypothetical protein